MTTEDTLIQLLSDVAMVLPNTPLAERAIALKAKLTATPEPAGETVRVRAGVYQDTDGHHVVLGWRFDEDDEVVSGWQLVQLRSQECSYTYDPSELGQPIAIIEANIPLPRIPTVAARVVEEKL
jgi:hypothetical protein